MKTPKPTEIKQARLNAGLTQTQAAELVHVGLRTWQQWEKGDRGMSKTAWALFNYMRTSIVYKYIALKNVFPDQIDIYQPYDKPGFLKIYYSFNHKEHGELTHSVVIDTRNKENTEVIEDLKNSVKKFREKWID